MGQDDRSQARAKERLERAMAKFTSAQRAFGRAKANVINTSEECTRALKQYDRAMGRKHEED